MAQLLEPYLANSTHQGMAASDRLPPVVTAGEFFGLASCCAEAIGRDRPTTDGHNRSTFRFGSNLSKTIRTKMKRQTMDGSNQKINDDKVPTSVELKAPEADPLRLKKFFSAIAPTPTKPDYSEAMYLLFEFIMQAVKYLAR